MSLALDHTIVPAKDKEEAARFFARIFGLRYEGSTGHFAAVKVNATLTVDFADDDSFDSHHLAFMTGRAEFDAIIERLKAEDVPYGSRPQSPTDMKIGTRSSGPSVHFRNPDGHMLQVLTTA